MQFAKRFGFAVVAAYCGCDVTFESDRELAITNVARHIVGTEYGDASRKGAPHTRAAPHPSPRPSPGGDSRYNIHMSKECKDFITGLL